MLVSLPEEFMKQITLTLSISFPKFLFAASLASAESYLKLGIYRNEKNFRKTLCPVPISWILFCDDESCKHFNMSKNYYWGIVTVCSTTSSKQFQGWDTDKD